MSENITKKILSEVFKTLRFKDLIEILKYNTFLTAEDFKYFRNLQSLELRLFLEDRGYTEQDFWKLDAAAIHRVEVLALLKEADLVDILDLSSTEEAKNLLTVAQLVICLKDL